MGREDVVRETGDLLLGHPRARQVGLQENDQRDNNDQQLKRTRRWLISSTHSRWSLVVAAPSGSHLRSFAIASRMLVRVFARCLPLSADEDEVAMSES